MAKPERSQTGKSKPAHKSGLKWTVRGISHETRTAASIAARRAGMSLGAWLEATIRTAATSEIKGESKGPPPVRFEDVVTALKKVADRQTDQGKVQSQIVEQLATTATDLKEEQNARFDALARQDEQQAKVLLAVADKLDRKIDGANRGRDEALKALVDKLSEVTARRPTLLGRLLGAG